MVLYNPRMGIESGDVLYAESETGWGHISEAVSPIHDGHSIVIEFDSHASEDEYSVEVNGTPMNLHIDVVSDVFAHADHLSYERDI